MKNEFKIKNLLLGINTSVQGEISIFLSDGARFEKIEIKKKSDELLVAIERFFKKNKLAPGDIRGIAVVSGPGSFTAVRQGVVMANALAFFLGVPVLGIKLNEFGDNEEFMMLAQRRIGKAKAGEIILPFYGREPNITKPKA